MAGKIRGRLVGNAELHPEPWGWPAPGPGRGSRAYQDSPRRHLDKARRVHRCRAGCSSGVHEGHRGPSRRAAGPRLAAIHQMRSGPDMWDRGYRCSNGSPSPPAPVTWPRQFEGRKTPGQLGTGRGQLTLVQRLEGGVVHRHQAYPHRLCARLLCWRMVARSGHPSIVTAWV